MGIKNVQGDRLGIVRNDGSIDWFKKIQPLELREPRKIIKQREPTGKLFGIEYPLDLVQHWNRVHNNPRHYTSVKVAYHKMYPDRKATNNFEFMEKEIRRRGWDCDCKGREKILRKSRSAGLYSYYF